MTTFKEISVEDYKKLLDNKQHTFAKTFKNIELLQKFENRKLKKDNIDDIIYDEHVLEKEDKYIEKLTDKLSEKINKNNGELLTIYNNDKKSILNFVRNVYKKYKHASLYKPRNNNIEEIPLELIMNSIKNNQNISKYDREHIYNTYKTNNDLKNVTIDYNEYENVMEDIENFRNVDITKDIKTKSKSLPSKKSLIPTLKDNISKTIIQKITGQGYNKIKIDQDLLKKNILKVRYISNNRKVHNDLLKDDYKISNDMKNAILKNKNINKLSKDEYSVYNALQKYKNNDNRLQLLISSYLSGNKSKYLYNKINEMLYNNYRNNKITKNDYQNIINKI